MYEHSRPFLTRVLINNTFSDPTRVFLFLCTDEKPEGCCDQGADAKTDAEAKTDSAAADAAEAVAAPAPAGGDSAPAEDAGVLDTSS